MSSALSLDLLQCHIHFVGTLPQVLPIEYLSPIVLDYQLPKTYPSQSPPNFTLSCKWLRLDQVYNFIML